MSARTLGHTTYYRSRLQAVLCVSFAVQLAVCALGFVHTSLEHAPNSQRDATDGPHGENLLSNSEDVPN